MLKKSFAVTAVVVVALLSIAVFPSRAADTLPAQYSDAEFWRIINDFSEPGGTFQYENFVSNEVSYQDVIPDLVRVTKPGGAYLGVAPEQNFTYIAAVKPKVAFILDIRRQNLIELLMYKALFEMSPDRVEFISRLFSRPKPAGLSASASADQIFKAFDATKADPELYKQTLKAMIDGLKQRGFKPVGDDEQKIDYIFNVFLRGGPRMDYTFASSTPNNALPSYANLMVASDGRGKNWAYLDTEDRYQLIRQMQQKNMIIPLVADFGGPKTIQEIGKYLKQHGALVSVFYISNVEEYIESSWNQYRANLAALPSDDSTYLIRFIPRANTVLARIPDVPPRWAGIYWH
jgi:hypothetical protein